MLTLQHSSYAFRLVQTLAVTGEYPVNSLPLLGNERVLKQLIRRLSLPEMFWNSHGEMLRTKLFILNGKGREKSLRRISFNETSRITRQNLFSELLADWKRGSFRARAIHNSCSRSFSLFASMGYCLMVVATR